MICSFVTAVPVHVTARTPRREIRRRSLATRSCRVRAVISEPSGRATQAGLEKQNRPKDFSWIDQWYPVIPEQDAPVNKPLPFTLFDGNYFLTRSGSGRWSVFEEPCLYHRVPLSESRSIQDPASSATNSAPRRYETRIEHKIIFMFLGHPENSSSVPIFLPDNVNRMGAVGFVFMRDIPCGFETVVENVADEEHVFNVHTGIIPLFKKSSAGLMNMSCEVDSDELRAKVSGLPFNFTNGVVKPCTVHLTVDVPGTLHFCLVLYIRPQSRTKTTLFVVEFPIWANPILRAVDFLTPSFLKHLQNCLITDGDNLLLGNVQRNLGEPPAFKEKCAVQKTDTLVINFRNWMESARKSIPWETEPGVAFDVPLSRRGKLDRFETHTSHCTICRNAMNGFRRLAMFARIVSNLSIFTAVACSVLALAGVLEVKPFLFAGSILMVVFVTFQLLRLLFTRCAEKFVYTERARQIILNA